MQSFLSSYVRISGFLGLKVNVTLSVFTYEQTDTPTPGPETPAHVTVSLLSPAQFRPLAGAAESKVLLVNWGYFSFLIRLCFLVCLKFAFPAVTELWV